MLRKIKTLYSYIRTPSVSKWFLLRYAFGQAVAYTGIGAHIPFRTSHYKLFLTWSPVAMVLFGDPSRSREEEEVIQDLLNPGDVALDLGANIGTWSLRAAGLVTETGRIYSFEAHPRTSAVLKKNVILNNFQNVTVVSSALGEKEGEVTFSEDVYDDVNHVTEKGMGITVPLISLDSYAPITSVERIRCIKLDVEGYEKYVLEGAEATITKTDFVIFEAFEPNCQRFGYSVDELFNWFRQRGFILLDPITKTPVDLEMAGRVSVKNILAQAPNLI